MTATELASSNIDFRAAVAFAIDAQNVVDALQAKAAGGRNPLSEGQRDALACAVATFDRYRGFALDIAERHGVDFVTFACSACSINYTLEGSRWEGFVSGTTAL